MMYLNEESERKRACRAFANTLHEIKILNDEEFDQMMYDIYEIYGDDFNVGDAGFYNDPL